MNWTDWWHGRGRRRAVDQLALVTAERDRWQALALERQDALTHADELITKVSRRDANTKVENERLTEDLLMLRIQHRNILDDYDELAARHRELTAELADLKAATPPEPDLEATQPIPVAALRFAHYAPNTAAA